MDIGQRVREVREDLGMQRTVLARRVGVAENTIYRIETGKRTPSVELLEKIARELRTEPAEFLREPVPLDEASETGPDIARSEALRQWEQGHKAIARAIADAFGFSVADLMEEEPASLAEAPRETRPLQTSQKELTDAVAEDEQPTREPLSPSERRDAAWMRRAELEGVLKHLTLRTETLRDQAKQRHQATDKEGLWALFLDSVLLAEGAVSLLAQNRKEAEELGGETPEERHLRSRLEHRTEDLDEVADNIDNMWQELPYAEAEAETEAEPPGHHDVPNIFRKRRAS